MTDRAKQARDAALVVVARQVAEMLPDFHGTVQFNVFGGKVAHVNLNESVRITPTKEKSQP